MKKILLDEAAREYARKVLEDIASKHDGEVFFRSDAVELRINKDGSAGTLFFSLHKEECEVKLMMHGVVAWCNLSDLLSDAIRLLKSDETNSKMIVETSFKK